MERLESQMELTEKFCGLLLTRCSEEGWCNVERPSVEEGAIAGDGIIRDLEKAFNHRQGRMPKCN